MLSLADLDSAPVGWLEELSLQEAGYDMAVAELQRKQKTSRTPDLNQAGQAVYGMPGRTYTPGRGFA